MTVYAVSYDLKKPGRNYQPLWDRLAQWKGGPRVGVVLGDRH